MSAEEAAKFCPSCGRANPDGHKFCPACGGSLVVSAAPDAPKSAVPDAPAPPAPKEAPSVVVAPLDAKTAALPLEARQTELQRLLTRANVERMRALIVPAHKTLSEALPLAESLGPQARAQVQEQRGDLYAMEERWQEALQCFTDARECAPERAVIEKKYAEMTVKIADEKAMARLGDVMLRGESLGEILADPVTGKRNAFGAIVTSMFVPGLGQMLSGKFVKGGIIMGVWALSMLLVSLSSDRDALFGMVAGMLNPEGARGLPKSVGTLTSIGMAGVVLSWLWGVFDAPLSASKTQAIHTATGEVIDKSGWEP